MAYNNANNPNAQYQQELEVPTFNKKEIQAIAVEGVKSAIKKGEIEGGIVTVDLSNVFSAPTQIYIPSKKFDELCKQGSQLLEREVSKETLPTIWSKSDDYIKRTLILYLYFNQLSIIYDGISVLRMDFDTTEVDNQMIVLRTYLEPVHLGDQIPDTNYYQVRVAKVPDNEDLSNSYIEVY